MISENEDDDLFEVLEQNTAETTEENPMVSSFYISNPTGVEETTEQINKESTQTETKPIDEAVEETTQIQEAMKENETEEIDENKEETNVLLQDQTEEATNEEDSTTQEKESISSQQYPKWILSETYQSNGQILHRGGQDWNSSLPGDSFSFNLNDADNYNQVLWFKNIVSLLTKVPIVYLSISSNQGTKPNNATYAITSIFVGENSAYILNVNFLQSSRSIIGDYGSELNFNYYSNMTDMWEFQIQSLITPIVNESEVDPNLYSEGCKNKQSNFLKAIANCPSDSKALWFGCGAGHSVLLALLSRPDLHITIVDNGSKWYTSPVINALQEKYSGRIDWICANTQTVILNDTQKYQFVYIDASKEHNDVSNDLIKAWSVSEPFTYLLINDTSNVQVYTAICNFINKHLFMELGFDCEPSNLWVGKYSLAYNYIKQ